MVVNSKRLILAAACLLAASGAGNVGAQGSERSFDVIGYTTTIRPDIHARTVSGEVRIQLRVLAGAAQTIDLDRADLTIESVRQEGVPLEFELLPRRVRVQLPASGSRGDLRALTITYHGAPRSGMQFVPEREQVYTIFSTSQWMVAVDAPGDKATVDLSVVLPRGLSFVGNGTKVSDDPGPGGSVVHRWRENQPVSTYLFGFAAGAFTEVNAVRGNTALRYLGDGFSRDELQRIFSDTPDMIEFFEQRAGRPLPGDSYTQVLVAKTAGQEAAGFSLLSDAYGRAVLDDPGAVSLIAHELAHQWWGNLVTCRDWTDFWLNEGFATFMAAAYDEHRFGRARYLEDIERARVRYEQVRREGNDRSLVFPSWDHPTTNDRTLVYQKGAYVLHLLREQLGDRTFWAGVREYTTAHAGQSVTTEDFQRSMEQSSGVSLRDFFNAWVYLRP